MFSIFIVKQSVSAACYGTLMVGDVDYGCSDKHSPRAGESLPGVTVSIANRKITLENYVGGPILITANDYGFDGNYEIELIGNNQITLEGVVGNNKYIYNKVTKNGEDTLVLFYNMSPTFTGTGTLEVIADVPFYFNYDYSTRQATKIVATTVTTDGAAGGATIINNDIESEETDSVIDGSESAAQKSTSFFETPLGIAVLIAVPSILVIIIIVLLVIIKKKNGKLKYPTMNPFNSSIAGQNNLQN